MVTRRVLTPALKSFSNSLLVYIRCPFILWHKIPILSMLFGMRNVQGVLGLDKFGFWDQLTIVILRNLRNCIFVYITVFFAYLWNFLQAKGSPVLFMVCEQFSKEHSDMVLNCLPFTCCNGSFIFGYKSNNTRHDLPPWHPEAVIVPLLEDFFK